MATAKASLLNPPLIPTSSDLPLSPLSKASFEMLVIPSIKMNELKRVLHPHPITLSPPWSPVKEKLLHSKQSDNVEGSARTHTLSWQVLPKSRYTPNEDRTTSYAYAAELTAALPIASAAMYILSEGDNLGAGAVNVYEDDENKLVGSDLLVDIRVYYNSPEVQKVTAISSVHSTQESGVRIHTAAAVNPHMQRFISINVRIPRATGSDPLRLPAFKTHLPNFVHSIGELAGAVHFSSISLSSSEKAIIVKSLSAERTRLRTSNGSIQGSFTSDSSISLRTSNAPITADVTLNNNGAGTSNLEVLTTFDDVKVDLNLTSTAPQGTRPSYHVHTRSTQKPVQVSWASAPADAVTQFDIQTTNARASLQALHSYEGRFVMHSTPSKPVVTLRKEGEEVEKRTVTHTRERRGLLEGYISGDGSAKTDSSICIKTSNAEAELLL